MIGLCAAFAIAAIKVWRYARRESSKRLPEKIKALRRRSRFLRSLGIHHALTDAKITHLETCLIEHRRQDAAWKEKCIERLVKLEGRTWSGS